MTQKKAWKGSSSKQSGLVVKNSTADQLCSLRQVLELLCKVGESCLADLGGSVKQYATCSLQNWPTESPQEGAPVAAAGAASVWAGIRLSCSKHSSKCGQDSLAVSTPTCITSNVTE